MVFYKFKDPRIDPPEILEFLRNRKIITTINMDPKGMNRFVTHYHISEKEVNKIVSALEEYFAEKTCK